MLRSISLVTMFKHFGFFLLCSLVTGLPQRPIVLTEYRSPPSANTRSNIHGRPGLTGTFSSNINPVPTAYPSTYNPNGQNLTFIISAKDLPNTAKLDNIDPYIKVYSTNKTHAEPFKFGTTEVIKDSPNAEFITVQKFLWKKGQGQKWVLKVKDSGSLRDSTVGEGIVDVDEYVLKGENINVTLKDTEGKPVPGTLLVQKTTPIKFELYARNLPRSDPFQGKSDAFVKCYWRRGPKGEDEKFYETKVQNDVENADWKETIEFVNYIKGTDLWFVFKVLDSDTTGEDELGEALVEIDPYVASGQPKIVRIGKTGQATLGITPIRENPNARL